MSILKPLAPVIFSMKSRVSDMWMVYTTSANSIAFSRKGRSARFFWEPNGGFWNTTSPFSSKFLISMILNSISRSRPAAFFRAISTAFSSISTPTTSPAPIRPAPMANMPFPQPRSITALSSTSPRDLAMNSMSEAMVDGVGYCSREAEGSSSWLRDCRVISSSLLFIGLISAIGGRCLPFILTIVLTAKGREAHSF